MGWVIACKRCGEEPTCIHPVWLTAKMEAEIAKRIRALYAIGKRCNPDHDVTSYFQQALANPSPVAGDMAEH